jgi:hypothetical protein
LEPFFPFIVCTSGQKSLKILDYTARTAPANGTAYRCRFHREPEEQTHRFPLGESGKVFDSVQWVDAEITLDRVGRGVDGFFPF